MRIILMLGRWYGWLYACTTGTNGGNIEVFGGVFEHEMWKL